MTCHWASCTWDTAILPRSQLFDLLLRAAGLNMADPDGVSLVLPQ